MLSGDVSSLSRLISIVENDHPDTASIMKRVLPLTGRGYVVGVTGFAGAGKSTLIDRLTMAYRKRGELVGVVAIDPSSILTGGAILGDRIRMYTHRGDEGVFIRSMATRGSVGGVAKNTYKIIALLDAFGFQKIIVETVGVGQDEVDIMGLVHTCLVVVTPGHGDDIQAMKAGLFEIADILIINKIDVEDPSKTTKDLGLYSVSTPKPGGRKTAVIALSARENINIDVLIGTIDEHNASGGPRKRSFAKERAIDIVISGALMDILRGRLGKKFISFKKHLMKEGIDIYAEIEHIIGGGKEGNGDPT